MNVTHPLTISILTIPERSQYLQRLLESIIALKTDTLPHVNVVYNCRVDGALSEVEARIRSFVPQLPVDVYFNAADPTIVSGRNLQLSLCRTPLIAFVDDDITLHGDIIPAILDTLASHPLALVGFRSFNGATDQPVKPRESTPSVDWQGLRFMPVQGMLCAGYRSLLADVGGFNPRRRYWGEWTELNLRLWRSGFPTAYQMERGYLRHWEDAPNSPTRNLAGREQHVVWGLICTALEYDAVDVNEATAVFWHLVEERYLAYSYGEGLSPRNVLKTELELIPRISDEWGSIQAFRSLTATHPFKFAPFHPFSLTDVKAVYANAQRAISSVRKNIPKKNHVASDGQRKQGTLRAALRRLRQSFGGIPLALKRRA